MKVDLISTKNEWERTLKNFNDYDFVHTFDFHAASQSNGEGAPLAFVAYGLDNTAQAFWPCLRRDIPNSHDFDLTSVYGYAGPLLKSVGVAESSIHAIIDAMRSHGAVSLFSRMHPLFMGQIPDSPLRGEKLSEVVVIEVRPVENVLAGYRVDHRRGVLISRKSGVSIIEDSSESALRDFIRIYRKSMADLNAKDFYYFSDIYFEKIRSAQDFQTLILFAELDGRRIAASMFIVTGKIMQYYLSGTDAEFRKQAPSKAIIAKAHELAIEMGLDSIILGGGLGSARDALFKFKEGFSDKVEPYYVTKRVLDKARYHHLCKARGISASETSFFPAYRA